MYTMIDVAEEKRKIYSLLFDNWKKGVTSRISLAAEGIIRSAFESQIKDMNLAQLNFCVSQAIHHLLDYCELCDPSIDLDIARNLITKFVIKATGYEAFWDQLQDAGLVSLEQYSDWI